MDLSQLECFVRVVEAGGFSRAATALSLTQPTLSRKVRHLEVELRKNLLLRDGRGVRLTEEGAIFLAHAKGLIEQAERAREEISSYRGSPTGKVVLAATGAARSSVIARVVTSFSQRFPKASLEVITVRDGPTYEWVTLGRVDIGIMCDPRPSAALEITPLERQELFLVSPASGSAAKTRSGIPFRQLARFPLILPGEPHIVRLLLENAARKAGIRLNVALQVAGGNLILDLVRQGHGSTVQPRAVVDRHRHAGEFAVVPIVSPRLMRTLTLVVSSQRRSTFLTQETVKLILDCFSEQAAGLPAAVRG